MKIHATKRLVCILLVALCGLVLQACTSEVDAGKVYQQNGLFYKRGSEDPFTGRVTRFPITALDTYNLGSCTLDVKKGLIHGKVVCSTNEGVKMQEAEYTEGKKDGEEQIWDGRTGKLKATSLWKTGRKHGLEQRFNPENGKRILTAEYVNGEKEGPEKGWDDTGEVLRVDLIWANNRKTGVEVTDFYSTTFKAGWEHGVQKKFGKRADGSVYVEREWGVKDNRLEGPWRVWDEKGTLLQEKFYRQNKEIPDPNASADSPKAIGLTGNPVVDVCVADKVKAYRQEKGADSPISQDLMTDWVNHC